MSTTTELTTTAAAAAAAALAVLTSATEQAPVEVPAAVESVVEAAPVKKLTPAAKARAKAAKIEADARAKAAKIVADAKAKTAAQAAAKKAAAAEKKAAAKVERPAKVALVFEDIHSAAAGLVEPLNGLAREKGHLTATVCGRKVEVRWSRPETDTAYGPTIAYLSVREFTGEQADAAGLNGKVKSGAYVNADESGLLSAIRAGFHGNDVKLTKQGRTELAKELDAIAKS